MREKLKKEGEKTARVCVRKRERWSERKRKRGIEERGGSTDRGEREKYG